MSNSYSGNPENTPKDAVRFLIGDTGPSSWHFSDEEIVYLLNTQANYFMAAAVLCDKLTTIVSGGGLASRSIGNMSESYSAGAVQFYTQQSKLFRSMGKSHQLPTIETITQKFSFRQFDGYGAERAVRADIPNWFVNEELT